MVVVFLSLLANQRQRRYTILPLAIILHMALTYTYPITTLWLSQWWAHNTHTNRADLKASKKEALFQKMHIVNSLICWCRRLIVLIYPRVGWLIVGLSLITTTPAWHTDTTRKHLSRHYETTTTCDKNTSEFMSDNIINRVYLLKCYYNLSSNALLV